MSSVGLLAIVVAVVGCGAHTKPKPPQHAPVPDVRGMNLPGAAVRLIKARYCVHVKAGTPPANDARPKPGKLTTVAKMPVERQSPPAGSTRRRWSLVTLTVGGLSKHAATYIDVWDGGAKIPCPPISATG
jgi:hypothetical protein